jgi:hypothetical protein
LLTTSNFVKNYYSNYLHLSFALILNFNLSLNLLKYYSDFSQNFYSIMNFIQFYYFLDSNLTKNFYLIIINLTRLNYLNLKYYLLAAIIDFKIFEFFILYYLDPNVIYFNFNSN